MKDKEERKGSMELNYQRKYLEKRFSGKKKPDYGDGSGF